MPHAISLNGLNKVGSDNGAQSDPVSHMGIFVKRGGR